MEGTEANSPEQKDVPKKEHKKIKISHIFVFLLVLSLAFNIFLFLRISYLKTDYISGAYFQLVKPSEKEPIDSNVQAEGTILHYNGLKSIIEEEIKEYNSTATVGVFIQDIKTGAWLGINEKMSFWPASLLKIPIMMAVLKKVQYEEIGLKDKITLTEEDIDPLYGTLYEKGAGAQVSIEELLENMILLSDNTAKEILKKQLTASEIDRVFKHIGIPNPYLNTNQQSISPRDYTRFFKALYYSTFLYPSLSEKALDLTTDTQQEDLISKGIPPEIQVAHKFGIVGETLLHDCGIVYHQENPYYICVMTNGLDFEKSSDLIRKISQDTYEFVEEKSKTQ